MSYSIYIEKENVAITIEEWKQAVSKIEGIRLNSESTEGINPSTNERISISNSEGSVAVLFTSGGFLGFGSTEEWVTAIHYHKDRAYFRATEEIENKSNPVRKAASKLAKALKAKIRSEEGEEYFW